MYKIIDAKSIEEALEIINGFSLSKLDVNNFKIDINQDSLIKFKNKILEYKDKKFFIVGDYDVDGIFSTTIICRLFDKLEIKHNYYIPSRVKEGYGLNKEIIDNAIKYEFDVLLCLDNGISANEEIEYAKNNGLKVFVIDHHEYSDLPQVEAIIHPNLLNEEYNDTCTTGLCYLLDKEFCDDSFSLVLSGIASLADMVKVFDYNRYIIKRALDELNTGKYDVINLINKKPEYTYQSLTFNVIPKINAVSRLGYNANQVVAFLLGKEEVPNAFVIKLDKVNDERKSLTSQMNEKANNVLINSNIIVAYDESFKEGLCGIVSTRIMLEYNKPAIVLSKKDGLLKGSGRSLGSFNLYEYLSNIKEIFQTFGGHEKALGISILEENIEELITYINDHPIEYEEEDKKVIKLNNNDVNYSAYETLERLMPFGTDFNEPLFIIENDNFKKYVVANKYPKYIINENAEAILFDVEKQKEDFKYIVGSIQKDNYYKNKVTVMIEDLVV